MNRMTYFLVPHALALTLVACGDATSEVNTDSRLQTNTAQLQTFGAAAQLELDTYVRSTLDLADVPGASVAVIQNGRIVFERSYGVKQRGSSAPTNRDTQFLIASVGKSITTMMMASVVDQGRASWDSSVQQFLPEFSVATASDSSRITLRDLVCNCIGAPRKDLELIYNGDTLKAADILRSVRDYTVDAQFGTRFSYNNQLVAIGGYAASVANGGHAYGLESVYANELKRRVLYPIGMTSTTTSFSEARARGNFATPHGLDINYTSVASSLRIEGSLRSIAPAGGHWSTVRDMARFVQTQLAEGVAPNGQRVVSSKNLKVTWTPQVKVAEGVDYGLGLFVSAFADQRVISHGGNSLGFSSQIAFVPSQGLGIVVLANQQNSLFNGTVVRRVLEIAFDQPRDSTAAFAQTLTQTRQAYQNVAASLQAVDAAEVEPFQGPFTNPALGEIRLSIKDGRLFFDAGEFSSELKKYVVNGIAYYVMTAPPLAGAGVVALLRDSTNQPFVYITLGGGYAFSKAPISASSTLRTHSVDATALERQRTADDIGRSLIKLLPASYPAVQP